MTNTTVKTDAAAKAAKIEADAARDAAFMVARDDARKVILSEAEKMGGQFAAGQMSLTHLAYLFSDATKLGYATEGDAADLYKAYVKGNNAAIDAGKVMIGNVEYRVSGATMAADDKSPVNNLRTFGRLAAAVQGVRLYEDVIRVRKGIAKEEVAGSEYVCMVRVNRALSKAADDKPLTDEQLRAGELPYPTEDELRAMMTKEATEKKDFRAKLEAAIKTLGALVKAGDANTHGLRKVYDDALIVQAAYVQAELTRKAKENRAADAPHHTLPANAETVVVPKAA